LGAAFGADRILDSVASHFKVSPEDVLEDKKEKRNISIYLIKKWTSMTNRQIGDMFGGLSYSAVSKANERFSAKVKKSKTLKRTVDKISYVKG
jgi:chromosomal replication initiation ATPase DnaA